MRKTVRLLDTEWRMRVSVICAGEVRNVIPARKSHARIFAQNGSRS
jgi:hypothetical protein